MGKYVPLLLRMANDVIVEENLDPQYMMLLAQVKQYVLYLKNLDKMLVNNV